MSLFNLTKSYDDFIPNKKGHAIPPQRGFHGPRYNGKLQRAAETWRPEYLETIKVCAAMGASEEQIAAALNVRLIKLQEWAREKLVVQWALSQGAIQATINVKKALYDRAVGYSHPETKIVSYEGEITDQVDVTKHYPPDTQAALAWLRKNDPTGGWGRDDQPGDVINNNVYVDNRQIARMSDDKLLELAGGPTALLETSRKP